MSNQFETLYAESERTAKVLGIPLHPFLVGQPLYTRYLEQALAKMKTRDRVWFTTGREIIQAYRDVAR